MRITIEDLEALKEMNDELEEGHVEAEKQLQREFGESGRPFCSPPWLINARARLGDFKTQPGGSQCRGAQSCCR